MIDTARFEMLPTPSQCLAQRSTRSNVNRINRNALDPGILHNTGDLQGRIVRNQRTYQVQASIQAGSDAARGDDTHTTERHGCTPRNGLAAAGLLPGVATLAGNRLAAGMLGVGALFLAVAGLLDNVRVLRHR